MQLSMGIWSTLKVMTTLKSKNLLGMGLQCKSCTSTLYSALHALHNTHSSAILSESTAWAKCPEKSTTEQKDQKVGH